MNYNESMKALRDEAQKQIKDRDELIRKIAEPMRKTALEKPCFTHEENGQAVMSGIFSKYLTIGNTRAIQVILSISPSDDLSEMFWHVSMLIISLPKGKAKNINLWTKKEKQNIGGLLVEFLGDVGNKYSQKFGKTEKALHCYRNVTQSEMSEILLRKGD